MPSHYVSTTLSDDRRLSEFNSPTPLPKRHGTSDFDIHRDSSGDDSDRGAPPPLVLKQKPPTFSFDVTTLRSPTLDHPPAHQQIPFPQTSPHHSPIHENPLPVYESVRTTTMRAHSHPSVTPLKSSIKRSSSNQEQHPFVRQARSHSAPSMPHSGVLPSYQKDVNGQFLDNITPNTPKKVHFADVPATVRVFHRSGRPVSVSLPLGFNSSNETDDSESSSTQVDYLRWGSWSTPVCEHHKPANIPFASGTSETVPLFQLDATTSSPIPHRFPDWTSDRNIIIESLTLAGGADAVFNGQEIDNNLHLAGTILVRNISFEKRVVIRFTFDDWVTVSEANALWSMHIQNLPPGIIGSCNGEPLPVAEDAKRDERGWDRFSFRIKLCEYVQSLESRTLFLAGRFQADGNREWWDNNLGSNYTVHFRRIVPDALPPTAKTPDVLSSPPEELITRQDEPFLSAHAPAHPAFPLSSSMPTIIAAPKLQPIVTYGGMTSVNTNDRPSSSTVPSYIMPNKAVTATTAQATLMRLSKLHVSNYACPLLSKNRSGESSNSLESEPAPETCEGTVTDQESLCFASDEVFDEMATESSEDGSSDVVTPLTSPLDQPSTGAEEGQASTSTKLPEFIWPEPLVLDGF
ncbi:putative phosphatase regulatory subunit-domain-containing protein [Flagelloscypha sp. PMI_526]|nr:putative phosphatase regulatory subunit-domain-containing protein [Flagelloscypha sp. PMI_526]